MRTLTVTLASILAIAAAAGPALAAFPGGNGRIAFVQGDVGGTEEHGIATANPDGSIQRLVGPTCQEGQPRPCPANPAWSRDATTIAFDVGGQIGVMSAEGEDVRTFSLPGLTGQGRPAWSPEASVMVIQAVDPEGERNLYLVRPDGTPVRQLTFAGGSEPAWSLDNRIAFVRNRNIYVIDADGTDLRRVTGKGGAQPNWSPYASQIAFVRGGNVYRVRQDGTGLRRLTGKGGFEPAWAPDGRRVLFHRRSGADRRIMSVDLNAANLLTVTSGTEGRIVNVFSVDQQPVR